VEFINASEDYTEIRYFIRSLNDNQLYSIQSSSLIENFIRQI